ncbi:MAG: hypothetical protein ABH872_06990 [Candidatus Omnitrophota bacterium]
MNDLRLFESIPIPAVEERIFKRLGYVKKTADTADNIISIVKKHIEETKLFISPKGCVKRMQFTVSGGDTIIIPSGVSIKSRSIFNFLESSREIIFMGATSGAEISTAIERDCREENVTRAAVYDACGSEIVDACLDWIIGYIGKEISRERCFLTRRFSAGYGDFSLSNQKIIYDELEFGKLGVRLTDSFMLVPEKSVLALAGIYEEPDI